MGDPKKGGNFISTGKIIDHGHHDGLSEPDPTHQFSKFSDDAFYFPVRSKIGLILGPNTRQSHPSALDPPPVSNSMLP